MAAETIKQINSFCVGGSGEPDVREMLKIRKHRSNPRLE